MRIWAQSVPRFEDLCLDPDLGLGFEVLVLGFEVLGRGFEVLVLGFEVFGLGFMIWSQSVPGFEDLCLVHARFEVLG